MMTVKMVMYISYASYVDWVKRIIVKLNQCNNLPECPNQKLKM